jgi:hypothetical protein
VVGALPSILTVIKRVLPWLACALIALALAVGLFTGCQRYVEATPRQVLEGDDRANYRRVFGREPGPDVLVVHSVVVAYSWRPGVVTSDDFEFELVVPDSWISDWKKSLFPSTFDLGYRKEHPIRTWYAPKPLAEYECYRDRTSVGYLHMLVDKAREPDGRRRVFFSKH